MSGGVQLMLPDDVGDSLSFKKWLGDLRLRDFALLFGHIWEPELGRFDPWTPWPGVRGYPGQPEMFDALETAEIFWLLKTRQIAATTAVALLQMKIGFSEEKALMLVFNKDEKAAKAMLAEKVKPHLQSLELIRAPDGGSLPWPLYEIGKEEIWFEGDNVIQAMASTASGAISRVPRHQHWDEVREYEGETAAEMYASNLPVLNKGAQLALTSTNKPGTWFSKMSQTATTDWRDIIGKPHIEGRDERGVPYDRGGPAVRLRVMPKVTFMFMPYDVRPERRADGWYSEMQATYQDDAKFRREFCACPEDTFLTREGLVFPSFKARNTVLPAHLEGGLRWNSGDEFWLFYDHGRTKSHPALCWFIHYRPTLDHAHCFDEVYADEDPELPDVAKAIMEKLEYWWGEGAIGLTGAVGDVTGKEFSRRQQLTRSIAECLEEEMGIHWDPAFKHDFEGSLELARTRVFHGRLTIDPKRCAGGVKQLTEHKFKDGTDKPSEAMDEACFTRDTEVLTPDGWVSLEDVSLGDVVAAVDSLGELRFEPCTGVTHKVYSGKMHHVKHHHLEFSATNDHAHAVMTQMDWKVRKRFLLKKVPFDKLRSESYWANAPAHVAPGPGFFGCDDLAWIAGFWLGDGCLDPNRPTFVIISQKKEDQKAEIRERLTRMGCSWSETKIKKNPGQVDFVISRSLGMAEMLRSTFGYYSYGKHVRPSVVMQMTQSERESFFDGYMGADGHWDVDGKSGHHFDSVSKDLIDGVQFLANCLGYGSVVRSYVDSGSQEIYGVVRNQRKIYRASVLRKKPVAHIKKSLFSVSDVESVHVHCVTTSTGMFYARTNGKPFVAGNCDLLRYLSHKFVGQAAEVAKGPLDKMLERAARREEQRAGAGLNAGMGSWLGGRGEWSLGAGVETGSTPTVGFYK